MIIRTNIVINGEEYSPLDNSLYEQCINAWDILNRLGNMEYARFYDRYIFKKNNKCYMAYVNNLTDFVEI